MGGTSVRVWMWRLGRVGDKRNMNLRRVGSLSVPNDGVQEFQKRIWTREDTKDGTYRVKYDFR